MLTVVCDGRVTLREIKDYLDAVVVASTFDYCKLFDASKAESGLTDEQMIGMGARIRSYPALGTMGALASMVITDHTYGLARLFGALAAANRPIRIFRETCAPCVNGLKLS